MVWKEAIFDDDDDDDDEDDNDDDNDNDNNSNCYFNKIKNQLKVVITLKQQMHCP